MHERPLVTIVYHAFFLIMVCYTYLIETSICHALVCNTTVLKNEKKKKRVMFSSDFFKNIALEMSRMSLKYFLFLKRCVFKSSLRKTILLYKSIKVT